MSNTNDKDNYILGPVSLTEHISSDLKKHIYLFGDLHHFEGEGCKDKKSIEISEWIKQILTSNPDKIIDIFLEVPYLPKGSEKVTYEYRLEAGYLFTKVIPTFSNCLQVIKSNCEYSNARFHYTDLRWLDLEPFIDLQYLIEKIQSIAEEIESFFDSNLTIKEARLTLEKISKQITKFFKVTFKFDVSEIMKNTKIEKQIMNIPNKKIKEMLNQKVKELFINEKLVNEGYHLIESLKYLTTEEGRKEFLKGEDNFNDLYDKLDDIHLKLMDYKSEFMDIFLLARMFRKFKDETEPKYILVYAGNDHINSYRKFLSDLGFKVVNEVNDENQCVDVSKFKQPYFSTSL